ncbi:bridge-like lipid transfer protein family member 1 isoform X2 [Toxorhynchites rutilus septentrionalis]|uniref:bridge-like lipid transfer protein family member 1 isoform X2 n=1 Tax=Toxorhynchites rutilus septentrionalis TaxID=329112 RepID=UPI002478DEC3|nr:bridge-like lipid transfer protein family member 1 isoform X2 [Toxorhynchites rutilus septentrionalis]
MSYEVSENPDLIDLDLSMGQFNTTQSLEEMKLDKNMVWLLFSLVSSIVWVTYITFYNSRVFGYFVTKLVNRLFIRGAYFKIGSLNVNPLAGKIMFRDVVYINYDYTVRVQDGYFIFRWWRSYVPKDVSEDLSHSDTRLSVMFNGLELHVYNRSDLYAKLERTFGLKPSVLIPTENMNVEEMARIKEQVMNYENQRQSGEQNGKTKKPRPEAMTATTWRDLIPVIKIDICSGRFAFGNRLTPTTLSICVEEAHCVYSTKPAVSKLDHFMHFVKAKLENAKVLLAPSPKYTGFVDEPPRYMGEGFVVMMSNNMELYFYMDEAGVVPEEPVTLTLANGDVVEASPPVWGIDIKCGKGTDFSYGPWADRQRDHLFRFFFPPDYQAMQVTKPPKPGDRREIQSFDVSLSTLNEATIDVLFSKNKETNAVHVNIGAGSYLELTLPWITLQDGFKTKVTGQLLHVEATTSLQYRSLAECETLQFNVKIHYPVRWNDHQEWTINFTGSKATAYIVFSHKEFFQDLIEDWASKARPDILSFVPYTWKFGVILKEFEIITLSNEYNWIDCSSTNQENHHLAFCGDLFDLSFSLPFNDFLPLKIPIVFWIHGEGLDLSMYLPEQSSVKPILVGMDENARILMRDGSIKKQSDLMSKKWRRVCQRSTGWIDCWTVPIVALSIKYIYHPMPPLGPDPQADITTPEKEEILLSPMRIPKMRKSPAITWSSAGQPKFDPTTLPPDQVSVELEIGSSIMLAYGSILKNFIHLKENIFGEDQAFSDMEKSNSKSSSGGGVGSGAKSTSSKDDPNKSLSETSVNIDDKPKRFDPRLYRPLEVTVSVTIHDLQAHIMKNCNDNDPPCPVVLIERLGFEMKKRFHETELQVLVSPSFLISSDNIIRPSKDKHLKQGHLLLSAVQVRGHAMFSNEGRQLEEETVEYAWLLEVQLGKLSGKMTIPQLCNVITGLETLAFLTIDSENELKSPKTVRYCHHGVPTNVCPHTKEDSKYRCPSTEDIKYRMTRIAVDAVDFYLIENGTAMHTWISPIRTATCNLHGQQVKSGVTSLIPTILLRQFVSTGGHFVHSNGNSHSNTNTTGSSRSTKAHIHNNAKHEADRKDESSCGMKQKKTTEQQQQQVPYLYRRDSKDHKNPDDPYGSLNNRRNHESDHFRREKEEIYASIHSTKSINKDIDSTEPWLEVGSLSLGPVIIEAASALPIPEHCLHLVQHNYLKLHDDRAKRLWFLWSNNSDPVRCGCVGGCAFFGSNRNGPRFFKPSAQDLQEFINIARYHIHPSTREYGFGQSLLHDDQLVFHTPPYSLQPVSLQECYEYVGKPNLRATRFCSDSKSPLPSKHESILTQKQCDISPNNTLIRNGGDKSGKSSLERVKEKDNGSPLSGDRSRGRRFSYSSGRQNTISHDVPYYRLLESSPKANNSKMSTTMCGRLDSESRLLTPKTIKAQPPKTSASDSRLTMEYFQGEDTASVLEDQTELSSSAPQPHPLESDSEYSISPKVTEEVIVRDVQRTVSLTSENHSEAFFSADEDLHASRSSSLKAADVSAVIPKKRFASDLSIVGPNELDGKLSTHRSDYEIHTPEHRSLPIRPQSTAELVDPHDSSESHSLSSSSFISALSSQEDITLVNLHMQINRSIVDSPLLMASYVTHLAQVRCTNWSHCSMPFGADAFSMPMFQQNEDGGLVYIGGKLVPHFDNYSHWREVKIVSRTDCGSQQPSSSNISTLSKPHPWDPNVMIRNNTDKQECKESESEFLSSQGETATRNSVVVRFKGQVDVMLTPLLLEGIQRMIESLIPTLATVHPLTIINNMHASCVNKVEAVNILKRDQSLSYWSQVHSNSKRSTAERNLQGPGGPVLTDVYEESISTQLQGLIVLPKMNVTLIQSSVIEEVISFAALDNVQELSCASLLAVCFEGVSTRFHLGKTTKASMHTVYTQPTVRTGGLKKSGLIRGTRALLAHLSSQTRPDNSPGEPVLLETSEKQLEELIVTLDVGKAHAQLRRLKNEPLAIQDSQIVITAIPTHRSRAMFDCTKIPEEPGSDCNSGVGFIMFECGMEGVCVKIVKRSQFEKSENAEETLKPTPEKIEPEVNQSSVTSNNPLNLVTLLNEAGGSMAAEALAKIGMKRPSTPKTSIIKDKNSATHESRPKEKTTESSVLRDRLTNKPNEGCVLNESDQANGQAAHPDLNSSVSDKHNNSVVSSKNDNGKTSSCVIDFKTVWFNFAAPPRTPITRKIDYSRLDWNLLSTASPAITAWMNPSNRLAIKVVALVRTLYVRQTAVMVALMADAWERQTVHRPVKSRYHGVFTPLAKTLQEDPSCLLCTMLQKYVLEESVQKIEGDLKQQYVPQLSILRQAVIVLSRQWKNVLYNPMLFEHQYKGKLNNPISVTFSLPQDEDAEDTDDIDAENGPVGIVENHPLGDEENEHTMLLSQSIPNHQRETTTAHQHHVIKVPEEPVQVHITKHGDSLNTSPSTNNSHKQRKKSSVKSFIPPAAPPSRASIQMFPIIFDKHDPQIEYGALKEGSLPSVCSSSDSMDKPWTPPPNQKEDLYSWMAKQQNGNSKKTHSRDKHESFPSTSKNRPEIHSIKYMQDNNRILDAHLIFEPMLTCLGVMPQQMINSISNSDVSSLDSLGTNLSLVCCFDTMRIDIVVSEGGDSKKSKSKINKKGNGKFSLIMPSEQPAFLCEHVGVELELLKMTDGFPDDAKHNMLYVSRGQLKKHTSTVINFSLNVRYLSQQVNMPLLRLLHQITNMYQNVKDAQNEMRDHPEHGKRSAPLKDESSLASEINDPTLMGSLNEPLMAHIDNAIFDYADERYDKFNEEISFRHELRHSVSRSKMPSLGPLIPLTPSPGSRSRPHSFAQKLRSTSKSVKGKLGYTNLNDTVTTPIKSSPPAATFVDSISRTSVEAKNSITGGLSSTYGDFTAPFDRSTFTGPIHSILDTPKCWKTIYHLLDLYSAMPEAKTIAHRVSLSPDVVGQIKARKYNLLQDNKHANRDYEDGRSGTPLPKDLNVVAQERTRLVVFGVAKIHRTRLLATLSGLKLEAEITALHSSTTWRKKSRPASLECSLTGQVGRAMIMLLEGVPPNQQTVVKVTIGKSQTLYSSITRKGKDKNNGLLSIGIVNIDIPQHPVALHGMMTRGSKQISSTLQELRVTRSSARLTRQNEEPESPLHPQRETNDKIPNARKQSTTAAKAAMNKHSGLLQPLVMQFNIILQSLSVTAALLPSLQAQYKMDHVTSTGVTGNKAKFTIDLPNHSLSFTTKVQTTETNLPSEACIALPPVHVSAEYIPESGSEEAPIDGVVLKRGGYLAASAEIGVFERCLSTDLLNHLVFVQKVFMKEVNEVVQKVYGGEKPVPIWLEDNDDSGSHIKRILFSLNIKVKRIQLTATTPCNSAVRFETGQLDLHLSNRVKNLADGSNTKLFGKAQIDLNLSLGQIIKNVIFDEAEPEFQQYAFFNTTIGLRNAFQDEMMNDDKELVLITLKRPLMYVQPIAVDKAILVWLNYKNAYEYWTEKRANLNKEVLMATQQVFEKVPFEKLSNHLATTNLSTLYLQLTVEDMGICLPLNQPSQHWGNRSVGDFEQKGAVVITLENTIISACSCGSLVSKGKFFGLCLRFADDFDSSLDEWKPNMNDANIMNLCVVSEGTYEVCSRTVAAKPPDNAKWFLNVKWQMEGVDIHLDVNIGKQLSALGHTLTMLTGSEDEEPISSDTQDSDDADQLEGNRASCEFGLKGRKSVDSLPSFLFDTTIDPKKRSLLMENEIAEQTKTVNDLRTLGASIKTIEYEERRLQELQSICFKYVRRDMLQKWKRPVVRKPMLKSANRSRSFIASSPTREDLVESADGCTVLDMGTNDGLLNSLQESPNSGPSRSASLRTKMSQTNRVTFTEAMRQSSLPSADSDIAFSESGFDWARYDSSSMTSDVPHLLEIDGEQVELRKKSPNHPQKQQEPNIDFELDIKVLVNSGKCVLHTKDIADEKMTTSVSSTIRHHRRERSIGTDWGSPIPPRRNKEKSRLKYNSPYTALVDLTIFHIPGLDVKLQYQSKIIDEGVSPRLSTNDPFGVTRKHGLKRATLFAWMTLQSIPEETIISPHILEFLEQTLEPIPSKIISVPSNPVNLQMLENNYAVYASFPVDVVVYFHMQPSTFRFSCLPVSRVECMLQLPSLDIIFSSNRQEEDSTSIGVGEGEAKSAGGLSVTGCLADFNVYIFHPYGGKKTNLKETHQFSPLADSERKDSLSINVEFVKFHITRSKKINYETGITRKMSDQSKAVIRFSTIVDIGSASFKYDMRRLTEILAFPKAWYRRSIVRRLFLGDLSVPQVSMCDLESVVENVSMKAAADAELPREALNRDKLKLSLEDDIPKLSTGSISSSSTAAKLKDQKSSSMDSNTSPSDVNQITSWETLVLFAVNFTKLNVQMNMGNVMGNIVWLTKAFRSDGRLSIGSTGHKNMYIGVGLGGSSLDAKGGIVGGTIELSKIDTFIHIKEDPGSEPDHQVGIKLLALELKFDYMGTSVLMTRISSLSAQLRDQWKFSKEGDFNNGQPTKYPAIILIHGDLSWDQLQMMISKSTTADILKMFYKLEEFFSQQFKSSKRVFSNLEPRLANNRGNMKRKQSAKKYSTASDPSSAYERELNAHDTRHHRHWQRPFKQTKGLWLTTLGVPLSNVGSVLGGTMELRGKNISLACFHGINFKSKSWALFSLKEPCINFATEAQHVELTEEIHVVQSLTFGLGMNTQQPSQHHSNATVVRMTRNVIFPPQFKTLHEWFHYAFANSEIDAVDRFPVLERDKEHHTNSFERSRGVSAGTSTHPKLQDPNHNREVIFALPSLQLHFKTEHLQGVTTPDVTKDKPLVECSFITEFEDHIFVTVDADAFFFLHDLITSYLREKDRVLGTLTSARASSPIHRTTNTCPSPTPSNKSMSKGSESASLQDSNQSFANGSAVNIPEAGTSGSRNRTEEKSDKPDVELLLRTDWRNFSCKTWHLEPTVRLLSWAGKSIEPYGIDYILNKLGFSHARTTIPKWLQRGVMDPLDKIEALLVLQLLLMAKENENDKEEAKNQ